MAKHDLSEGWVVLREPKSVPERLRRPILALTAKAVSELENSETETTETKFDAETMSFFNELNDLLAIAMVKEWSFGEVTLEALLDLPMGTYDEIRELVSGFVTDLMPSFSPSPDPKVTTVPSNG